MMTMAAVILGGLLTSAALNLHCGSRAIVELSPYNSDAAFGIRPEADATYRPRCLRRAPDGRGLRWMASGGSLADYGECRSRGCPMSMVVGNG